MYQGSADLDRPTPQCPRCGYDQSGAIAAWDRATPPACPLQGVCSECGLEFAWADVVRPERRVPRGFFEHARGPWQWLAWSWVTLGWALCPWVFWTRVTLFVRPVAARILVWPLAAMVLPYVAGSTLRMIGYGLGWYLSPTWRPNATMWTMVVNCWIEPVAQLYWTSTTRPRPARFLTLHWTGGRYPPYIAILLLISVCWPVLMMVLSQTMRASKLRREHVLRAMGYSLVWLPLLMLLRLADAVWLTVPMAAGSMGVAPSWRLAGFGLPLLLIWFVWMAAWWWFALRRGFRLRHAPWVWVLFVVATGLAAANAVVIIFVLRGPPW